MTRLVLGALLAGLVLVDCSVAPGPSDPGGARPSTLVGTAWRVVAVGARVPAAGAEPTLVFSVDRVTGSGGCNHFGGRYRYDSGSGQFAVAELAATAMGCPEPGRSEIEAAFFQALGGANAVGLDDAARLILAGPGEQIVLGPDAGAPPPAIPSP